MVVTLRGLDGDVEVDVVRRFRWCHNTWLMWLEGLVWKRENKVAKLSERIRNENFAIAY